MGKFSIGVRVRDKDGDEGVIVGKPGKGSRDVRYETGICQGSVVEALSKDFLDPIVEEEPAPTEAEQWVPKVGDRVNWTRVRGEFDNSTIVEYEGEFYDHKLLAPNGNYTYAYVNELEPVSPWPSANDNDNLVVTVTAANERIARRLRLYADLLNSEAA